MYVSTANYARIFQGLYNIHKVYPEVRLGQILENFRDFVKKEKGTDLFYLHDKDLAILMDRFAAKETKQYDGRIN